MTTPASITYRFTRADCWNLAHAIYRPTFAGRVRMLAIVIVATAIGVAFGFGGWPTARQWSLLTETPWPLAIMAGLLLLSQFAHYINVAVLWLRFRSLAIADKTVTLTFGDDAVEADVEGMRSTVPWGSFVGRILTADAAYLKIGRWEALTVPRRAFADDESWHAALAFLKQKVPHGPA